MCNYSKILRCDIANRNADLELLYGSLGCDIRCKGCFNSAIWEPTTGKPFTDEVIQKIINASKPHYCFGLSILGGEPTSKWNIDDVIKLCKLFKETYPEKDIYMWSGRTIEEIRKLNHGPLLLQNIDCLIDGRFIEALSDMSLKWKGSSNQMTWKKVDGVWKKEN